jgi:hypothetical protein
VIRGTGLLFDQTLAFQKGEGRHLKSHASESLSGREQGRGTGRLTKSSGRPTLVMAVSLFVLGIQAFSLTFAAQSMLGFFFDQDFGVYSNVLGCP